MDLHDYCQLEEKLSEHLKDEIVAMYPMFSCCLGIAGGTVNKLIVGIFILALKNGKIIIKNTETEQKDS